MTEDLKNSITEKQHAVHPDAFLAKKKFDSQKKTFDQFSSDLDEDYVTEMNHLRHEMKLMMSLLIESKFEDVIQLIANPTRLMAINFIIGFVRGIGFCLAVLVMALVILLSLSDMVSFGI